MPRLAQTSPAVAPSASSTSTDERPGALAQHREQPDADVDHAWGRKAREAVVSTRVTGRFIDRQFSRVHYVCPGARRPSHRLRDPGARRRGGHRAARPRPPGRVPVHARRPRRRLPLAPVDDAPVRRLRVGRGDERALPAAARARADGPVGGVRPADAARASTPTTRGPPGEVGRTGVAIDSVDDMPRLFDGIPLGEGVSTSMTINAPASLLLLLYELVGAGQGADPGDLRGTIQNDMLKEYGARGNYIFPPRPSMRLTIDTFRYASARLPRFNTISISGYHIREAGSTAVQELGVHARQRHRLRRGGDRRRARRSTTSRRGCRSSSTRTTTSSRRSPSSARRAASGRTSCATASARAISAPRRCASTPRRAARR